MSRYLHRPALTAFALACCISLLSACDQPTPVPTPADKTSKAEPAPMLRDGIDVSHHSGMVDWEKVRAEGHGFAFVKATEGVDFADPDFDENWRAMKQAGITRGAYHFYVTEDDPSAQARFFISKVTLEAGDLAPVLDIELIGHGTQPGLADRLRTWLDLIEDHYGLRPILYTSPNFWNENVGDGFGAYPLWIAEYEVDKPTLPQGWTDWHLWQWQPDATVPGVEKNADLSRANHDGVDLSALIVP